MIEIKNFIDAVNKRRLIYALSAALALTGCVANSLWAPFDVINAKDYEFLDSRRNKIDYLTQGSGEMYHVRTVLLGGEEHSITSVPYCEEELRVFKLRRNGKLKWPPNGKGCATDEFSAVELPDRSNFICGGFPIQREVRSASSSTWLLNSDSNDLILGPKLNEARANPTLTLLSDSRVLISGGFSGYESGPLKTCEIFDSRKNVISPLAELNIPRAKHGAAQLAGEYVMFAGGVTSPQFADEDGHLTASVEILSLKTKLAVMVGKLHRARYYPVVIPVGADKAAVLGGFYWHWLSTRWLPEGEILKQSVKETLRGSRSSTTHKEVK